MMRKRPGCVLGMFSSLGDVLVGYSDWPALAQVFQLARQVINKKTGEGREVVVAGVTSLALERADAARLLMMVRGHWHIENTSHWVRDVTCDEDRSPVRCSNIPQVMAALRHTAIGLMRWAGETNIAAACHRFADQPVSTLELSGMQVENCMALGLYVHALTCADFHAQYTLARFTRARMPTRS